MKVQSKMMYPNIQQYIDGLKESFSSIPDERKAILNKIVQYISQKRSENRAVNLVYICTHNSRRSHFGQVWAHVAAAYYGIDHVHTFSGGTEATAFNVNAINALKRIGFKVQPLNEDRNTTYQVFHDGNDAPCICFSKTYDDAANPQKEFAAIMTCSDAEENCPYIPGAEMRIATTYDDPKIFDNTPQQDSKYDERCRQIALETLFVFSGVKGS